MAQTARCADGRTIRVGSTVRLQIRGAQTEGGGREPDALGPSVVVVRLHRQGYDGTIVTTEPAPDPAYSHHFSGRATHFMRTN